MILSLFIIHLACALTIPRKPFDIMKIKPEMEFMPKLNLTYNQRKSQIVYEFVPEIEEIVDEKSYTVSFIFPVSVNPQTIHFKEFSFINSHALIVNGSMESGAYGFRYRKFLPDTTSEFKLEYDVKNNQSVKVKAFYTGGTPFSQKLLGSHAELKNDKYIISTYLPGLNQYDIYVMPTDNYLFVTAFKKRWMSYEVARIWPVCSTKDYQWDYSEEVLTISIVLDKNCTNISNEVLS